MLHVEKAYYTYDWYEALDFIDKLDSLNLEILKIPYQINNSIPNQPHLSYLIVLNWLYFFKRKLDKRKLLFQSVSVRSRIDVDDLTYLRFLSSADELMRGDVAFIFLF